MPFTRPEPLHPWKYECYAEDGGVGQLESHLFDGGRHDGQMYDQSRHDCVFEDGLSFTQSYAFSDDDENERSGDGCSGTGGQCVESADGNE